MAEAYFYDDITDTTELDITSIKHDYTMGDPDVEAAKASPDNDDLASFRRAYIGEAINAMSAASDFVCMMWYDIDMQLVNNHPDFKITARPSALKKWAAKLNEPKTRVAIS